MVVAMVRSYEELSKLKTYEERFDYLKLSGSVGEKTFGFDRYLNQEFYRSPLWRRIRDKVFIRDLGCDLGVEGYPVGDEPYIIHHMNPISVYDLKSDDMRGLLNPRFLITVTKRTHNAIHYGGEIVVPTFSVRKPFDTCPWRQE